MLWSPDVLDVKAPHFIARLLDPTVFSSKVLRPIAVLLFPVWFFCKELLPIAMLYPPVERGKELKAVVEPIDIFVGTFLLPVPISKLLIEPVTVNPDPDITNEPVITADPENGKPVPLPPEEFIVTIPVPPAGEIVMLLPATIWVTPPPGAYEADNA